MSSPGGRGCGAVWGLRALVSFTWASLGLQIPPKAPHKTVPLGVRFKHVNLGITNIQTLASSLSGGGIWIAWGPESRLDGSEPRRRWCWNFREQGGWSRDWEKKASPGALWTVASSEWLHSFRPKMVVGFYYFPLWNPGALCAEPLLRVQEGCRTGIFWFVV